MKTIALIIAFVCLLMLAATPATAAPKVIDAKSFYVDNVVYTDPLPQPQFKTGSPESQGMKSATLAQGVVALNGNRYSRSFIVIRNGVKVVEQYLHGGTNVQARNIHSASKSILSCLVGEAASAGKFGPQGLNAPIGPILTKAGFKVPTAAASLTPSILIRMASGFSWDEDNTERSLRGNFGQQILNLRLSSPGKRFNYSTGDAYLMGVVLQAATGKTIPDLLASWNGGVCSPTAISRDSAGYYSCCCNFFLTPLRMAAFGQIALNKVNAKDPYMLAATKTQKPSSDYGFYYWTFVNKTFIAWGWNKQMICVRPDLGLIFVCTCDTSADQRDDNEEAAIDIFSRYVVGAVK